MNSPHKSHVQTIRAYLLGTLSPEQTDVVEQQYFLDRSSLLALEQVETALIAHHLARRLSSDDGAFLAQRYLQDPVLAEKVEAARALQSAAASPRWNSLGWGHAAFATAAFLIAITGATVYWSRSTPALEPPIVAQAKRPAELTLSPGIT